LESDLSEFAYHRSAICSDNRFSVFFKISEAADAERQFEVEVSNLRTLREQAGVLVPECLDIVQTEGRAILLQVALEAIDRGSEQWRQIGKSLARIHRVKGEVFGYARDGFWGPLHQDNTVDCDYVTFFRDRRLLPLLNVAIKSGNLPPAYALRVERVASRLSELCGSAPVPTLLHGDAQQNNFICTARGTYVIDPAIYYGHTEWDLALIDSWQPVPKSVFDGYANEAAIPVGFPERRDLWRIPLYLAAVALEGEAHVNRLGKALRSYE